MRGWDCGGAVKVLCLCMHASGEGRERGTQGGALKPLEVAAPEARPAGGR